MSAIRTWNGDTELGGGNLLIVTPVEMLVDLVFLLLTLL